VKDSAELSSALTLSHQIQGRQVSDLLVGELCQCSVRLRAPVAEGFVGRLLVLVFADLATRLVSRCCPSSLTVVFTFRFALRHRRRSFTSPRDADTLFVMYRRVNGLVECEQQLLRECDVIHQEYLSPFNHAHAFAHCPLSLSPAVSMINEPLFNMPRACATKRPLPSATRPRFSFSS
jgi:hypothetical protein